MCTGFQNEERLSFFQNAFTPNKFTKRSIQFFEILPKIMLITKDIKLTSIIQVIRNIIQISFQNPIW